MTLEKLSLDTMNFYAPTFEIEIEDRKIAPEMHKAIMSVSVEEKMDQVAGFSMTLSDGLDMKTQEFKWLDNPLFREKKKVAIKMGYSGNLFEMIVGKITAIESDFFSGETPTITIRGDDLAVYELTGPTRERAFIDMKYSEIVKTIAGDIGLNAIVDPTGKYEPVLRKKNEESYLVFIEEKLRKKVGFEFKVEGKTLYFIKPGDEKKELFTLKLGKDLISFNPVLRTSESVTMVEVRAHNPNNPNKPFVGKAGVESTEKLETGKKVISNVIVTSDEQAQKYADAELQKAGNGMTTGTGDCIGIPGLRKGVNINLEGMGKLFSGSYYVIKTTHTIDNNGYKTQFSVKKNEKK